MTTVFSWRVIASRECAAYLDKIAQSLRLFVAALFKGNVSCPAVAVVTAGIRVGVAIRAVCRINKAVLVQVVSLVSR